MSIERSLKLTDEQINLMLGILDTARIDAILEETTQDQDELQDIIEILERVKDS